MNRGNISDEYYQQRKDEIVGWMEHELELAAGRDKHLVNLLRTKIQWRTERDGRTEQLLRDTVAETIDKLEANNERIESTASRAKRQLSQCADGLRRDDCGDDGENHLAALAQENARLADLVRARRERLDEILEDVRYAETDVDRKTRENDRLRSKANKTAAMDR